MVNTGRPWIKHYRYVIPSSCLLCFISIPNSMMDHLIERCQCDGCLRGERQRGCLWSLLLKDTHELISGRVLIYVILMSICIWENSYLGIHVCQSDGGVASSLPLECWSAVCLILISGSTVSAFLFSLPLLTLPITEFFHLPWRNSSGILSQVNLKDTSLIYHWCVC